MSYTEWIKQIGNSGDDYTWGIATDSIGNVYLTGHTFVGIDNTLKAGATDAWVAKYDGLGNLLWTDKLVTSEEDWANGVATDIYGNVYVTGQTGHSLGGIQNAGGYDAWLAKYDTYGNLLGIELLGTTNNDGSRGVATDNNGYVYITGFTWDSFEGQTSYGVRDAWLAKYDGQGNYLGLSQIGTSENDISKNIISGE